jgi:polyhydroxybutyrate depolymerase
MKISRWFAALALPWLSTLPAMAGAATPGEGSVAVWRDESLQVGGTTRWFRVYETRAYMTGAPAVVVLHGGTQSMRKIFEREAGGSQAWRDVAEREGLLLLAPNGTNVTTGDTRGDRQTWNDVRPPGARRDSEADDVAFIGAMLDWAERRYRVDPQRIYVTGASNGGMMTYRLLIEAPERFAAGAAFIASLPEKSPHVKPPRRPTPLMIANGTADPLVPWEGGDRMQAGFAVLSAEATVAWWVRAVGADAQRPSTEALPDLAPDDRCRIHKTTYPVLAGGAPVVFFRLEGGGHAMPSMHYPLPDTRLVRRLIGNACADAEGAELAWEFMRGFRRR